MNSSSASADVGAASMREASVHRSDVILIGCVSRKKHHSAPAKDLYSSDLFRKRRAYAEARGHPWFILSAKHGLVQPERILKPYDETLNHHSRVALLRWGEGAVADLAAVCGPLTNQIVEIHAGKRYAEGVEAALRSRGAQVVAPLKGRRIGEQLAWYKWMLEG